MATKFCPQCGSPVSSDDRFCASCGAALGASAAPPRADNRRRATRSKPLLSPRLFGAIALAGVLLIVAGLLLRENGAVETLPTTAALQPASTTTPATELAGIPFPSIPRIDPQQARERQQDPGVVFVDVRGVEEYEAAHIAGALSIPLGADELDAAYQEIPRDAEIITYCT